MASDSSEASLSCQEKVCFQLLIAAPGLFGLVVTGWTGFTLTLSQKLCLHAVQRNLLLLLEETRGTDKLLFSVPAHP